VSVDHVVHRGSRDQRATDNVCQPPPPTRHSSESTQCRHIAGTSRHTPSADSRRCRPGRVCRATADVAAVVHRPGRRRRASPAGDHPRRAPAHGHVEQGPAAPVRSRRASGNAPVSPGTPPTGLRQRQRVGPAFPGGGRLGQPGPGGAGNRQRKFEGQPVLLRDALQPVGPRERTAARLFRHRFGPLRVGLLRDPRLGVREGR